MWRSPVGESTAIAWTDHTFNPWWGCERVSPGCQHCYAETFAKRTGNNAVWGKNADRRRFGDKHWNEPLKWNRTAEAEGRQHLVFCASMADVFEDRPDHTGDRARLWELIEATPFLTWQLLTKRPENVSGLVPARWMQQGLWPHHVWIGATVEDQRRADERIPILAELPAPVRFLSCEPLLGPVVLDPSVDFPDWVICGGESGPNHRPLDLDHARSLRDQCDAYGIPFFFKQIGGRTPMQGGDLLDGQARKEFPASLTGSTAEADHG